MSIDPYIVVGSAVVGLLVGVTGAGGGALMTPMLVLLFSVKPSSAISSDLVAAVVMRPFGAAVHWHKGTVNWVLVRWLVVGAVPTAFLGAYLLHLAGDSAAAEVDVERVLGSALLLGAGAMVVRLVLDRGRAACPAEAHELGARPLPTLLVGVFGGLLVGFTSVGSGSLMIVLLLFVYPAIGAKRLVGTDLVQAVPLTLAAAVGSLVFGHVELGVTASLVVGSVPAVIVGSRLSSRAPDRQLRPVIGLVIFASGLKYVGVGTDALASAVGAVIAAGVAVWVWRTRRSAPLEVPAGTAPER